MNFRADIQGMRGISVLLVVLFHCGSPGFAGGYVGVDIFFVISGFLISGMILQSVEAGRFSLADFYLRRVRRILPAALVCLALFGAVAVGLFPGRSEQVGREILWSAPGLANFLYAAQSDYFAPRAEEFVFLHYWSLAVEEQFYFLWPLLLSSAAVRFPHRVALLLSVAVALAFLAGVWFWHVDPTRGFYLLPGRAWELGSGALAFLAARRLAAASRSRRSGLAIAGGAAIVAFLLAEAFGRRATGPLWLLPVVLGASVLLAAGGKGNGPVARLLALPPLQWLGAISFSLYLVHWPLLVMWNLWQGRQVAGMELPLFLSLAAGLAWANWRYVEEPVRRRDWRPARLVGLAIACWGITMFIGVFAATGMLAQDAAQAERALAFVGKRSTLPPGCMATARDSYPGFDACGFGAKKPGPPDVWLLGDSHADHWEPGFAAFAARAGMSGVLYSANSTLPMVGLEQVFDGKPYPVAETWRRALPDMFGSRPALVVLAARWSVYYDTRQFLRPQAKRWFARHSPDEALDIATSRAAIETALVGTIGRLQAAGHRVVLLGQVPEYGLSQVDCARQAFEKGGDPAACGPSNEAVRDRLEPAHAMLQRVVDETGARLVLPHAMLCGADDCRVTLGDVYLYRDSNHLNAEGSRRVVDLIADGWFGRSGE
ncbi:acyltransferase family protein [Oricola thermophila]|uniref:Acyltransferase n=1 Tax=Oricola thermophila TaxID=2742145 RepID=A0A6N1VE21_9HYPH|nr:acyltransferase family protein [Oricola thermophila]QKV18783.1 acyltransferase [Oricola thermophila]